MDTYTPNLNDQSKNVSAEVTANSKKWMILPVFSILVIIGAYFGFIKYTEIKNEKLKTRAAEMIKEGNMLRDLFNQNPSYETQIFSVNKLTEILNNNSDLDIISKNNIEFLKATILAVVTGHQDAYNYRLESLALLDKYFKIGLTQNNYNLKDQSITNIIHIEHQCCSEESEYSSDTIFNNYYNKKRKEEKPSDTAKLLSSKYLSEQISRDNMLDKFVVALKIKTDSDLLNFHKKNLSITETKEIYEDLKVQLANYENSRPIIFGEHNVFLNEYQPIMFYAYGYDTLLQNDNLNLTSEQNKSIDRNYYSANFLFEKDDRSDTSWLHNTSRFLRSLDFRKKIAEKESELLIDKLIAKLKSNKELEKAVIRVIKNSTDPTMSYGISYLKVIREKSQKLDMYFKSIGI